MNDINNNNFTIYIIYGIIYISNITKEVKSYSGECLLIFLSAWLLFGSWCVYIYIRLETYK